MELYKMKKLIGYVYLNDNEELKKWQIANPDKGVCSVSPQLSSMVMKSKNSVGSQDLNAETVCGVFVTYTYESE